MYILIILSIVILCIILYNQKKEHFYNIIPYKYRWNIGKCWDSKCLTDKLIDCNKWCNLHGYDKHTCKYRCARYADNQLIYNRFGYHNWMKNMYKFDGNNMINKVT